MHLLNLSALQQRQLLPILSDAPSPITALSLPPVISDLPLPTSLGLFSSPASSASSASSTSSSVSSTTSSVITSTSPTPSITATPSIASQSAYETTSGGRTVTVMVDPSVTSTPMPKTNSFLQNKGAEGVVFSLVGIVALVIIFTIVTFAIRRRRQRKLVQDAISFDPATLTAAERGSTEKISIRTSAGSDPISRSHGYYGQQVQYNQPAIQPQNIPGYPGHAQAWNSNSRSPSPSSRVPNSGV
ncbi:hypothetical protein AX17_000983 [Amanita inopinata Kibby_2008]|nr:hypothetical protein AX17_000983 [Amanita inopinata Kibby_2008]